MLSTLEHSAPAFVSVSDAEIIANVVRLCRSERFPDGPSLLAEVAQMYQDIPVERIKHCARYATLRMLRQLNPHPADSALQRKILQAAKFAPH